MKSLEAQLKEATALAEEADRKCDEVNCCHTAITIIIPTFVALVELTFPCLPNNTKDTPENNFVCIQAGACHQRGYSFACENDTMCIFVNTQLLNRSTTPNME